MKFFSGNLVLFICCAVIVVECDPVEQDPMLADSYGGGNGYNRVSTTTTTCKPPTTPTTTSTTRFFKRSTTMDPYYRTSSTTTSTNRYPTTTTTPYRYPTSTTTTKRPVTGPNGPDGVPICDRFPPSYRVCEGAIADNTCKNKALGPTGLLPYGNCDNRFLQCVRSNFGYILYTMDCPNYLVFSNDYRDERCIYPKDNSYCQIH